MRLTYGDSSEVVDSPVEGYYLPDAYEPRLHIDARCNTRRRVINTLAHEMVHQLQHELGVPLTHGKLFKAQAKRLAKHGLTI